MTETVFYLPELSESAMWIRLAMCAGIAVLLTYFFMLILLNTVYRNTGNPRDLDIALSRFWSLLWCLVTMQIFTLLVLDWNLGDVGREALKSPSFIMRFLPDILVSTTILIAIFTIRRDIKNALKN